MNPYREREIKGKTFFKKNFKVIKNEALKQKRQKE